MTKATSRVERYRPVARIEHGEALANHDLPTELRSLFQKTPLLSHEDPQPYWALLRLFAQEIKPGDTIEWLWLKDILDQSWEIIRLHLIKAALIDVGKRAAIAEIFAPGWDYTGPVFYRARDEALKLADEWFNTKSRSETESRLQKYGLDADSITAVSFSMQASKLEAVERMLAELEFRRNNTLREYEARRERLGRMLRQASDTIINAESSVLPSRRKAAK